MFSIIRQADEYGLPTPPREAAPPPEKVADLLKAPPLWEGPMKVANPDHLPGPMAPLRQPTPATDSMTDAQPQPTDTPRPNSQGPGW